LANPTTCPRCDNAFLIAVYAHRLCDRCGWHTANFEKMQFRGGLDKPLKRNKDGSIDLSEPLLDFLCDIPKYGLWEKLKMQAEDGELYSQVMAWRSRWMPVSNNASIKIQPAEPKPEPELEKPKQILLPAPTSKGNGIANRKKIYQSPMRKLIRAGLEAEKALGNEGLRQWMLGHTKVEKLRAQLQKRECRVNLIKLINKVRTDLGIPAPR
jgi:hypothetical protein